MSMKSMLCVLLSLACAVAACGRANQSVVAPTPTAAPTPAPTPSGVVISTDAALFALVTQTEPFASYSLFPNADAINRGPSGHLPTDRVTLNAKAASALQNGKLPPGSRFPDGSVVFKEILGSGGTTAILYSVIYKDAANPLAANGWLWAEFNPGGSVAFSINNRGVGCTSCHSLGQGPTNDFVRTFERQNR